MYSGIIYCWRNKTNGKRYIGQTACEDRRKQEHIRASRKKHGWLNAFHTALREYGIDNFSYRVLFRCESEDKASLSRTLDDREQFYIRKYKSCLTEYGYNETIDGQYNKHFFNNSNNQNRKLKLKRGKPVKVVKETKRQEAKRLGQEAAVQRVRNLCDALGVPMAIVTFEDRLEIKNR